MVSVVEARVITEVIAHQESTGSWAASSWPVMLRKPDTSASTRVNPCTSAMLLIASVARSNKSV